MRSQSRLINRKANSTLIKDKNEDKTTQTNARNITISPPQANSNTSNKANGDGGKNAKATTAATTTKSNNSVTSSNNDDQACNICAQNVPSPEREKIFAFGKCDHYVCYVCSARLRVICEQSECPICREKLDYVLFTSSRNRTFDKYPLKNCLINEKHKIYFENESIKAAFENLLKFECQICADSTRKVKIEQETAPSTDKSPTRGIANSIVKLNKNKLNDEGQGLLDSGQVTKVVFDDVFGLKNHLNFVHKLNLCDLCLTHNKLFPFEYSFYDKLSLRKHIEKGEPKTSHRGHPNCALCQQIFFNAEELLLHMSREHYHCHLCGRHDSNNRIYFLDYRTLRGHFKNRHILCERDNCKHEQFTSVFDNEIDFHMHLVEHHPTHTSGLSRGEARHQRTITLEQPAYRSGRSGGREAGNNDGNFLSLRPNQLPPNTAIVSTGPMATANSSRMQQSRPESMQAQLRQQRLPSRAEFPVLGQNSTNPTSQAISLPNTGMNFPCLAPPAVAASGTSTTTNRNITRPGSQSSTSTNHFVPGPSTSRGTFARTFGGGYKPPDKLDEMDFPPLPEQPKAKNGKKTKKENKKSKNDDSMSLERLISNSLSLSNKSAKKSTKGGNPAKATKQKPIKIQL